MAEDPKMLEASGSGREAEREEPLTLPVEAGIESEGPRGSTLRGLQERRERFEKSAAGRYWGHLSTADFMNSSFAFAALAVLSAFPFLAVSSSVVGVDIRTAIVARMGLNPRATHDINGLIATGNQAVATLTWFSAIVLVLGGIGMASTLSAWYHRIYERKVPKGFLRHFVYQSAGVVAFTLYIAFQVWLFGEARPLGGRGLVFLLTFVTSTLFWWWSSYMLPSSPTPADVSCRRRDRSLRHGSRHRLRVLLLRPGHVWAAELRPCRRGHSTDHLPRRLRRLPPRGRGLRPNVERAAGRTCLVARLRGWNSRSAQLTAAETVRTPPAMNVVTPHLALLCSITTLVGAAMIRLGIVRGRLEARQTQRRCPSCGRSMHGSVCRACTP